MFSLLTFLDAPGKFIQPEAIKFLPPNYLLVGDYLWLRKIDLAGKKQFVYFTNL